MGPTGLSGFEGGLASLSESFNTSEDTPPFFAVYLQVVAPVFNIAQVAVSQAAYCTNAL
jgi:hypothetical protein